MREDIKITVPAAVGEDIQSFIEQMSETEMRLEDIGISCSKDSILDIYRNMYTAENV